MEIPGTNNSDLAPAESKSGLNGTAKLAEDFDSFLNLLVTQLQNQDPLEPLKANEFTNQLVQFSGVEQQLSTNSKLDELVALQGNSQAATAAVYVGKDVTAESDQLVLQDSKARFAYELEGEAANAVARISDASGEVVRTLNLETAAGRHEVTWDGEDQQGAALPDGAYSLDITAADAADRPVESSTMTIGTATGFELRDGGVILNLGDVDVELDSVRAVHESQDQAS